MEFQDEVDRYNTSLWAAQTYPEDDLARGDLMGMLRKRTEDKAQIAIDDH